MKYVRSVLHNIASVPSPAKGLVQNLKTYLRLTVRIVREIWPIRPGLTGGHMAYLGHRCLHCFYKLRTVGITSGG